MKKIITLLVLHSTLVFFAQTGTIDNTFNTNDVGYGNAPGANSNVLASAFQSDGKIIICGNFNTYNETFNGQIARLNSDGTLDRSFNSGDGTNYDIKAVAIQSDDKIIIGGEFTSYHGISRNYIARLNSDGSLDTSFVPDAAIKSPIETLLIQTDGKVIIGGSYWLNGTAMTYNVRLDTNGSIDTTFNSAVPPKGLLHSLSIQKDGKIIVGGFFYDTAETTKRIIVRLNTNGSLDNTFQSEIIKYGYGDVVYTTLIQTDGKIYIGGRFEYDSPYGSKIARLNADGSIDKSFSADKDISGGVNAIALQSDGKIIIGGDLNVYKGTIIYSVCRLESNGSVDMSFDPRSVEVIYDNENYSYPNGEVLTVLIQPTGNIIIGGRFGGYNGTNRGYLVSLNTNGKLNESFNPRTAADGSVNHISLQTDGKIIISGDFKSYNNTPINHVARLNADGSLDTSFKPTLDEFYTAYTAIAQPDGKIIIGGNHVVDGKYINAIFRLNTDGSLDTNFNTGSGLDGIVLSISLQPDGKIIIGGDFRAYNGTEINNIARLNADGSLDTNFNGGSGPNYSVWVTALQSNGKILIGGTFSSYNGVLRKSIARLNTDGTLDKSFNSDIKNSVWTIAVQSNDKIIIGGNFIQNNTSVNSIARLNADGSFDNSFNSGSGVDGYVHTVSLQMNGKIIIGGDFKSYNGVDRNEIACLNPDGSLDTDFMVNIGPGTGIKNIWCSVKTSVIQSDGKIIIGGDFTSYDEVGKNRIVRLNGDNNLIIDKENSPLRKSILYPNPTKNFLQILDSNELQGTNYTIIDFSGKVVMKGKFNEKATIDVSGLQKGFYILSDKATFSSKFIKE